MGGRGRGEGVLGGEGGFVFKGFFFGREGGVGFLGFSSNAICHLVVGFGAPSLSV